MIRLEPRNEKLMHRQLASDPRFAQMGPSQEKLAFANMERQLRIEGYNGFIQKKRDANMRFAVNAEMDNLKEVIRTGLTPNMRISQARLYDLEKVMRKLNES
jgi:hypothetical protein